MPYIEYVPKTFNARHETIIAEAESICQQYAGQGYTLTLRQLYYQFVQRNLLANTEQSYDLLGRVVVDARLAGRIDWSHLEDRTRNMRENPHWDNPADILDAAARSFRRMKWADQPEYVEVWVEKEALAGVIEGVCNRLDVPWLACRGYMSHSEMWTAGQRFIERACDQSKDAYVLYLGDHDPSGLDMTDDIQKRLHMFTDGYGVTIRRIALNMNQIDQYQPPPNPAKISDSRAPAYIERYGPESWELDSLPPNVLVELIQSNVMRLRDEQAWSESVKRERTQRQVLTNLAGRYDDVAAFLEAS